MSASFSLLLFAVIFLLYGYLFAISDIIDTLSSEIFGIELSLLLLNVIFLALDSCLKEGEGRYLLVGRSRKR